MTRTKKYYDSSWVYLSSNKRRSDIEIDMAPSLHEEISSYTSNEDSVRDFLFRRNTLKDSYSCPACNSSMLLDPCAASKSSDLRIWSCSPGSKFKNIRSESVFEAPSGEDMLENWTPSAVLSQHQIPDQHSYLPAHRTL